MFRFYSKSTESNNIRVSVVGEHTEGMLKIAVARCSSKDHYEKKIGRSIAEKRLNDNNIYISIPMDKCDVRTFVLLAKGIAADVSQDPRKIPIKKEIKS